MAKAKKKKAAKKKLVKTRNLQGQVVRAEPMTPAQMEARRKNQIKRQKHNKRVLFDFSR